jgi:antitoxin MazE
MVTTIQRWGNSLAIRIPKPFAVQAQLSEDADVEITLDGDRLVITPAKREWNLDKLLRQVSPSNLHHEVRWGDTKGKEVW